MVIEGEPRTVADLGLPAPRHVLFVTGEYPPMRGGVGDYTACLSRALAALGSRCSVVTGRQARQAIEREPLAPTVCPAMAGWGAADLGHLVRLIDDLGPDVVHVQYQTGAFGMAPGINLLLPRLRLRRPRPLLAVTLHDLKEPYLFPKAGPIRAWANAATRRAADLVFVTNGDDLAALGGRADVLPIGANVVAPSPTATERQAVRARLGLTDGDLAVGFFGFIDEWKGVDTLLEAVEALVHDGVALRLVFVGGVRAGGPAAVPAYEQRINARLESDALRGHFVRTGFAPAAETAGYLHGLDVCALPFSGGACFRHGTLVAAIANGLPLVTTRPSAAELRLADRGVAPLVDGANALLVEAGDARALAAAIRTLRDDLPLRARLAAGARALAPQFGWEQIARTSLAAYETRIGALRIDPSR